MTRRSLKYTRAVLVVLALTAGLPLTAERLNVLFIMADDLGWSDTTLYGHTQLYETPHLERIAKRGMTFTRAFAASPLCSPTRSAILTGLSPARTGITAPTCHLPKVILKAQSAKTAAPNQKSTVPVSASRLDTRYRTIAETLKDAGYVTGHFGKWHLGPEPYSPLEQGFDVDLPHWPGPGPAGSFVAPWKFKNFDHDPGQPNQHIEDRMAKEAVAFMETHKDTPFFLNYWMFSVHAPFDAKKALIEKYRSRVNPNNPQRSPTYAAMIESMDDAVGTLLDAVDRLGLTDKTIIVFTSDNGGNMYDQVDGTTPTSNAPLRGGKATMFQGGTRVPAIVCLPGLIKPGSRSDAIIQSEDFYPTLLDILELKPEPNQRFDGVSIVQALKGGRLSRDAVFQYFPHSPGVPDWLPPAVSVHRGDWKLIRIFHGGDNGDHRYLLYNLREDIGEKNNRAAEMPDLVAELDSRIEHFLTETGAIVPTLNPNFNPATYRPEDEGIQKIRKKPPPTAKDDPSDPALKGWKARNCNATVKKSIVTMRGTSATPFLGVAPGIKGPATLRFRIRSIPGGPGRVAWIPQASKETSTPFTVPAGGWQTLSVEVPVKGRIGILRLYLPAQSQPVEIDWVELQGDQLRRWEF